MYAKCGNMKEAYNTFNTMLEKDWVAWRAMIIGLRQHKYMGECFKLFHQMISKV
jgi:pentatricopeptide repeat protein